jgi:hypothetical protein
VILRAVAVWASLLNGGVRDIWLSPWLGDTLGRALSVGALWSVLTLAFEFVVGHYGFGKAWSELLADYDLRHGRIWVAVLIVTLLAPLWAVRLRQARARQKP